MKTLAIVGASGHGKVVADVASKLGWDNIVFFDDKWPEISHVLNWSVLGCTESIEKSEIDDFFVAIGDNIKRKEVFEKIVSLGKRLPNLFHPTSMVSDHVLLGKGVFIGENAVVKISSVIGDGVVINSNSVIGHDCTLSKFSHITPGCAIAGNVIISDCCWIGNGSSIRQQIKIGEKSVIGTGSVVVKDIPPNVIVVGNPAKQILK